MVRIAIHNRLLECFENGKTELRQRMLLVIYSELFPWGLGDSYHLVKPTHAEDSGAGSTAPYQTSSAQTAEAFKIEAGRPYQLEFVQGGCAVLHSEMFETLTLTKCKVRGAKWPTRKALLISDLLKQQSSTAASWLILKRHSMLRVQLCRNMSWST